MKKPRIKTVAALLSGASLLGCIDTTTSATESDVRNPADGSPVLFWNATGIAAFTATALGPRGTPLSSRIMAMTHVAMADAVFSIHPVYKPLIARVKGHGSADETAAAVAAAHKVLVGLLPGQTAALDAAYATSLAAVPDGKKKDEGILVGETVADAVLADRVNDGSELGLPFTPPVGLGYWAPDPRTGATPFYSSGQVRPFVLTSNSQFRPGPPADIFSDQLATDTAELKEIGGTTSTVRTAEQSCIARTMTENSVAQYNRFARTVAAAAGPKTLEENVRIFAQYNLSMADTIIAAYEAKFTYVSWRPWQVIQVASQIGHPELEDTTWTSFIPTPAHPEYPAGHGVASGQVVGALRTFYGEELPAPATLTCVGANCRADICPASYSSTHLDYFEDLILRARIYGGLHNRYTMVISQAMGEAATAYVIAHSYRHGDEDDHGDED